MDHALPSSAWTRLVDVRYDPGMGILFPWTVGGAWMVFAAARRDQ
ncbi:hypothetical protein ACWFRQ_14300 [Streptomyces niveus]